LLHFLYFLLLLFRSPGGSQDQKARLKKQQQKVCFLFFVFYFLLLFFKGLPNNRIPGGGYESIPRAARAPFVLRLAAVDADEWRLRALPLSADPPTLLLL
jgi:hypothetical protein